MNQPLTYEERIARILFLREHRRNLLRERCEEELEHKRKQIIDTELRRVRKALRDLDPDNIFPP